MKVDMKLNQGLSTLSDSTLKSLEPLLNSPDLNSLKKSLASASGLDKSHVEAVIKYVYLFGDLGDKAAVVETDLMRGSGLKLLQAIGGCFYSKVGSEGQNLDEVLQKQAPFVEWNAD